MTLSIRTFSKMTLCVMTLGIMPLGIVITLFNNFKRNNSQHNDSITFVV